MGLQAPGLLPCSVRYLMARGLRESRHC